MSLFLSRFYVVVFTPDSISGGLHEWGTGTLLSGWRILTDEEWYYVLYNRSNCSSKRALGNILGLILLPDEWVSVIYKSPRSQSFVSV